MRSRPGTRQPACGAHRPARRSTMPRPAVIFCNRAATADGFALPLRRRSLTLFPQREMLPGAGSRIALGIQRKRRSARQSPCGFVALSGCGPWLTRNRERRAFRPCRTKDAHCGALSEYIAAMSQRAVGRVDDVQSAHPDHEAITRRASACSSGTVEMLGAESFRCARLRIRHRQHICAQHVQRLSAAG
jgi:hypothetical protein